MEKYFNKSIMAVIVLSLYCMAGVSATKVYMTDLDITSQAGGSRYWAASLNPGDGAASATRVSFKQDHPGSNYYRPGQSAPEGTSAMSDTPKGYGWATEVLENDIPSGQWKFKVTTKNSRSEDGGGRVTVYVFKSCSGTNTKLFSVQGTTEAASSTNDITQVISISQSGFSVQGCRLKFEYWLTISDVEEDTNNNLQKVATSDFYAEFPGAETPLACTDSDLDTYQSASCGGNDCNDNNANIHPGAAETCNDLDDDCDGQIDEGCTCTPGQTQQCGTETGACEFGTQTCQNDGTWGQCIGGVIPTAETCNSLDDDCDGQVDEGQICSNCTFAAEACNGIDDNCNNQTDEGIVQPATCGSGACKITISQSCINGEFSPACVPAQPTAEVCNGIDDNCNNQTDENLVQSCGINLGECRLGTQSCSKGKWSQCLGEIKPDEEICDFKDNDCDGSVDEGDVCKSAAPPCIEDWQCEEWVPCINNTESTRLCTDKNSCDTEKSKPAISRKCLPEGVNAEEIAEKGKPAVNEKALFSTALIGSIAILLNFAWKLSKEMKPPV